MAQLINAAPPRLPAAPTEYEKRFHDQHSDVLRLYFNQLGGNVNALTGTRGGQYLNFPYAAIQRTTSKTFTANTATQITFDQNDYLNGCTNDGTDGISVEQPGIYNYQFSVQFASTNVAIHDAWVWLRKNNVDIPGTGSQFSIPNSHGGTDGHLIGAANFYVQLAAGDTVEMWAAVDNTSVTLAAYPAQTSPFAMPAIPSVVATLSFVSSVLP
jgi:hypothetical protein